MRRSSARHNLEADQWSSDDDAQERWEHELREYELRDYEQWEAEQEQEDDDE